MNNLFTSKLSGFWTFFYFVLQELRILASKSVGFLNRFFENNPLLPPFDKGGMGGFKDF